MKRSVSSQNFCRLSERHASPGDLDKQGAVLQKLLSWVYWLYVFQSNCQLLPSVFISFFIFYFTIFRHPPKPSYGAWPSNFRPRAMEHSAQESWDGAGHASSVHVWQLSDPLLRFTNRLLPQMPACLKTCHSLLFISLDEILINLFLQTAINVLAPWQVTSPVNTTTSSFVKWR